MCILLVLSVKRLELTIYVFPSSKYSIDLISSFTYSRSKSDAQKGHYDPFLALKEGIMNSGIRIKPNETVEKGTSHSFQGN